MTAKIYAGQTHIVAGYPFVRYVANLFDNDDGIPYQTEGWRPGCTLETDENAGSYFPERHYVADGVGSMVLDVVATFRPSHFPERVFYTRRWIDPDGREFGKPNKLRVTTTAHFRSLLKGYRHPFEVSE
jgi:hypothetical protein